VTGHELNQGERYTPCERSDEMNRDRRVIHAAFSPCLLPP